MKYHHTTDPKVRPKSTYNFSDFVPNYSRRLSLQTPARVRTKIKLSGLGWNFTSYKAHQCLRRKTKIIKVLDQSSYKYITILTLQSNSNQH